MWLRFWDHKRPASDTEPVRAQCHRCTKIKGEKLRVEANRHSMAQFVSPGGHGAMAVGISGSFIFTITLPFPFDPSVTSPFSNVGLPVHVT